MIKDRIRNWALGIIFGLLAVVIQATVFHGIFGDRMDANLIFGLILWIAFFKTNPDGALLSFLLVWLQGAVSGTLSGIFLLAGMSLYLVCWLLRERLAPRSMIGQFAFALGLGVFYKLVLLLVFELFAGGTFFRVQPLGDFLLEVLFNAILAILIFTLFSRIQGFFDLIPEMVEPRRG